IRHGRPPGGPFVHTLLRPDDVGGSSRGAAGQQRKLFPFRSRRATDRCMPPGESATPPSRRPRGGFFAPRAATPAAPIAPVRPRRGDHPWPDGFHRGCPGRRGPLGSFRDAAPPAPPSATARRVPSVASAAYAEQLFLNLFSSITRPCGYPENAMFRG